MKVMLVYVMPVLFMIWLIPIVNNEILLSLIYIAFTATLLAAKREKNDILALGFGLVVVTVAEYFFVSTGVETFTQNSLLGVMPLWLPFLWAYIFVSIKRTVRVLDNRR